MTLFSQWVRRLAAVGIALAAAALIASMLLVSYAVVMRYFLNQPPPWVDEVVGYLLVAAVMLAAADALLQGEHIAVDILTEHLGELGRKATLLIGLVTVAISGALLVNEGVDMVGFSHMVGLNSNGFFGDADVDTAVADTRRRRRHDAGHGGGLHRCVAGDDASGRPVCQAPSGRHRMNGGRRCYSR